MDKDVKDIITVMAITLVIIGGIIGCIFIYSGMSSPITVVESESMQHSDTTSELGIIDTGDMVIMRDPSSVSVTTYVEGRQNGYGQFGEYGDVIIYYRDGNKNPVIHRAMIWLDYNGDGTWSAESLKDYDSTLWTTTNGTYDSMSGFLILYDVGYKHLTCSVNLDSMSMDPELSHSGYITKGDHNNGFDQPKSISGIKGLIEKENIKAVAGVEIPWLGCIKLYINNTNINMIPENSVPCLIVAVIDLIAFFVLLSIILDCIFSVIADYRKNKI